MIKFEPLSGSEHGKVQERKHEKKLKTNPHKPSSKQQQPKQFNKIIIITIIIIMKPNRLGNASVTESTLQVHVTKLHKPINAHFAVSLFLSIHSTIHSFINQFAWLFYIIHKNTGIVNGVFKEEARNLKSCSFYKACK